jgi:hypothetical protein
MYLLDHDIGLYNYKLDMHMALSGLSDFSNLPLPIIYDKDPII